MRKWLKSFSFLVGFLVWWKTWFHQPPERSWFHCHFSTHQAKARSMCSWFHFGISSHQSKAKMSGSQLPAICSVIPEGVPWDATSALFGSWAPRLPGPSAHTALGVPCPLLPGPSNGALPRLALPSALKLPGCPQLGATLSASIQPQPDSRCPPLPPGMPLALTFKPQFTHLSLISRQDVLSSHGILNPVLLSRLRMTYLFQKAFLGKNLFNWHLFYLSVCHLSFPSSPFLPLSPWHTHTHSYPHTHTLTHSCAHIDTHAHTLRHTLTLTHMHVTISNSRLSSSHEARSVPTASLPRVPAPTSVHMHRHTYMQNDVFAFVA